MIKAIQKLLLLSCISTALLHCNSKTSTPSSKVDNAFLQAIQEFPKATLPLEIHYPTIGDLSNLALDSQFVAQYIDPELYAGECSCMYYQGSILLQNEKYVALLLPLEWNAGTTYELRTFSLDGRPISQMKFAQLSEESITGHIDSTGLIRQLKVESFLEEEEGLSPDHRQLAYFQIQEDGSIQVATQVEDKALSWLGQWNWQTPFSDAVGTLWIGADKLDHIRLEFIHTYNNGGQTRDYAGVALLEQEGEVASSLELGCLQLRRSPSGIQVEGDCLESWDANFSGDYLSQRSFPYRYLAKNDSLSDDFCDVYQVWNSDHSRVQLPGKIQEQLNCGGQLGLSPDWQQLIYADEKGVSLFDINQQTQQELIPLQAELEGLSTMAWSNNGKKAAFVEIQQEQLAERTRLHIISFEAEKIKTQHFDIPVHFFCGGACFSIPYEDFWWDEAGNIRYLNDLKVKQQEDPSDEIEAEILQLDL